MFKIKILFAYALRLNLVAELLYTLNTVLGNVFRFYLGIFKMYLS